MGGLWGAIAGTTEAWSRDDTWQLLGVVLTAAGFLAAWIQLRRTATAQEESNELLGKVQGRILSNELLLVIPALHTLEDDIHRQVAAGERELLVRSLVAYSKSASETSAALEEHGGEYLDFRQTLDAAALMASRIKAELASDPSKDVAVTVQRFMKKLPEISTQAHKVVGKIKRDSGEN